MEDTLRDGRVAVFNDREDCLNPCSNGRYSQRIEITMECVISNVLILVLMEDTLREQNLRVLEFRGFDNSKTYKIGFY